MSKTSISALQEFMQSNRKPNPVYTEISTQFGVVNSFTIRCSCDGIDADGEGPNKKVAKHRAAGHMIKLLRTKRSYSIDYWESDSPPRSVSISPVAVQRLSLTPEPFINHVGKLNEFCESKRFLTPEYTEVSSMGPSHLTEFTIECKLKSLRVNGTGATKKQAKQNAAAAMRDRLKLDYKLIDYSDGNLPTTEDSGTLEELVLPFADFSISESKSTKTATERARNLFPELKKNLGVVSVSPTNITISNFHKAFKASFDNPVLERFYKFWASHSFDKNTSRTDLEAVFEHICSILELSNEKRIMKVKAVDNPYLVSYKLKSTPPFIDIGVGKSSDEAHVNALRSIITAIHLLLI